MATMATITLDDLPGICIDAIAHGLQDMCNPLECVQTAATLTQVCKSSDALRSISDALFDVVDPGCVSRLKDLQERELSQRGLIDKLLCNPIGLSTEDATVVGTQIGNPPNRTLRRMLPNLGHILRSITLQPTAYKCPVRSNVRMGIAAYHCDDMLVDINTARTTYKLTRADLSCLPYHRRRNPFYRRAPATRMYLLCDVIKRYIAKFGPGPNVFETTLEKGVQQLHLEKKEVNAARTKAKRAAFVENCILLRGGHGFVAMEDFHTDINDFVNGCLTYKQIEESCDRVFAIARRKADLVKKLNEVGCVLRDDSRLCNQYIQDGFGDIDYIVNTMREMKFFHDHTDYPRYMQCIMDALVDHEQDVAKALGFWLTADDYRELRYQASSEAKHVALCTWARTFASRDAALASKDLPPTLANAVALC